MQKFQLHLIPANLNIEMEYKLDKNFSRTSTIQEQGHKEYWKSKPSDEILQAAVYLIKTSYGFFEWPKMEKKLFYCGKLKR